MFGDEIFSLFSLRTPLIFNTAKLTNSKLPTYPPTPPALNRFIIDLLMSFNLAYRPNLGDDLITDRKKIAKNYLKCWFWIDLVASVPFDRVAEILASDDMSNADASNNASALGLLKGLRLPRLLRLLKVMRLLKIFRMMNFRPELVWWFQYSRHANLFRLLYLLSAMLVLVHYIACM